MKSVTWFDGVEMQQETEMDSRVSGIDFDDHNRLRIYYTDGSIVNVTSSFITVTER